MNNAWYNSYPKTYTEKEEKYRSENVHHGNHNKVG